MPKKMNLKVGRKMNVKTQEIYSEVYSILNLLGDNYVSRLPISLLNIIKETKLDTYNPQYEATISLEKQNIKRETIALIALLHLNYWCDSDEEKEQLRLLFKNNEERYQAEIREKYNPDNIFKKNNLEQVAEEIIENETAMIQYKESIFKKLINRIKAIFCKY